MTMNPAMASTRPLPIRAMAAGHALNMMSKAAAPSSTVAPTEMGPTMRPARAGATRLTMMPAAIGSSTVIATSRETALAGMRASLANAQPSTSTARGTNTMASSAAATSSPTAYDARPPALSSFLGRIGGTGETASAISTASTGTPRSKAAASPAATSGMTTFIARSERTSWPGRRNRYSASWWVAPSPRLNTIRKMLARTANPSNATRSITGPLPRVSEHRAAHRRPRHRSTGRGERTRPPLSPGSRWRCRARPGGSAARPRSSRGRSWCRDTATASAPLSETRSANFDRLDLSRALIDRDRGQFAFALGRQPAEVIHDRLPFLDLPGGALPRRGGHAALVHHAWGRQQVGRVAARVVEGLDPRRERLPLLVLGNERQLALRVLRDRHGDHGEIQRAREAVQARVLPADVDGAVAAIEVSDLDGRHDVELGARRVVPEPHAGGAREVLAGVGRVVHEQELEQMLQLLAGEVAGHERAAGRGIHHAGAEGRHGEHVVDGLHA